MRAAFLILGILWAIGSVSTTGNYRLIRRYLWALLTATTITELYLTLNEPEGNVYLWTYAVVTIPILFTAIMVGWHASRFIPPFLRRVTLTIAIGQAGFGLLFSYTAAPIPFLMSLQASILSIAGVLTLVSLPVLKVTGMPENAEGSEPFWTLGLLWVMQAIVFYLYANGAPAYPAGWSKLGEWVPALLVILGMAKLGFDFHTSMGLPVHARSRG